MEDPEERNDVEEREADPVSMFLAQLDASTPMPRKEAELRVLVRDRYIRYNYGITRNPRCDENAARVHQADLAYKALEAARKRAVIAAWTPIVTGVSSAVVALAGAAVLIVYRIT